MKALLDYLSRLPAAEREAFARRCGTSLNYLRKAASAGQRLGESLCISIERESHRTVLCEQIRPDVDWAYLRGTAPAPAHQAPEAINSEATQGGAHV